MKLQSCIFTRLYDQSANERAHPALDDFYETCMKFVLTAVYRFVFFCALFHDYKVRWRVERNAKNSSVLFATYGSHIGDAPSTLRCTTKGAIQEVFGELEKMLAKGEITRFI